MYQQDILLSSVENVKKFISIANSYNFPINIVSGKYRINGKSIMGIFSLDLSKPVTVEVEDNDYEQFKDNIQQFIVEN